jgi:hypothetical protein
MRKLQSKDIVTLNIELLLLLLWYPRRDLTRSSNGVVLYDDDETRGFAVKKATKI